MRLIVVLLVSGVALADEGPARGRISGGQTSASGCDPLTSCCLTGDQTIAGTKTFSGDVVVGGNVTLSGDKAVIAPYVLATTWSESPVFTPGNTGQTAVLLGMKTSYDPGPDIQFWSYNDRDAGDLVAVMNGYLNRQRKVAAVSPSGTVLGGCGQAFSSSGYEAAFQDCSAESGHIALSSPSGYYLGLQGLDSQNHAGIETDGGCPIPDGGIWVSAHGGTGIGADGGVCDSYYNYAGFHGNVTLRAGTGASSPYDGGLNDALYGGLLFELQNPQHGGDFTDKFFWVDWGGFSGTSRGLTFSQLAAEGLSVNIITSLGQYRFGHRESGMQFAFDTHRPVFWTNLQMLEMPATYDVLSVHGGEAAPQAFESGKSTFITGGKGVSFGVNFNGTPNCSCSDTTAHNGCWVDDQNSTSATFAGTGSDTFDWQCTGPK